MGSSQMDYLEEYSSIEELGKSFESVKIVMTQSDFEEYVNGFTRCDENYFRGVCTAKYKMYNSAQRFYCYHKNALQGIAYDRFLSSLYKISSQLDNGYLKVLYDRQFNCIRYRNNCKQIGYNPIWAYSALQHITQCAPLIDFTSNLDTALYFAVNGYSTHTNYLDDYLSIITFRENAEITNELNLNGSNKYWPFIEVLLNAVNTDIGCACEILSNAKSAIEQCDIMKIAPDEIRYITYNHSAMTLNKNDINYRLSFANDNIVRQQGKLLINNSEDTPFELLWSNVFPCYKLKITLIDKSLRKTICTYLTENCICHKTMLPIKKNYEDEIIKLIQALV